MGREAGLFLTTDLHRWLHYRYALKLFFGAERQMDLLTTMKRESAEMVRSESVPRGGDANGCPEWAVEEQTHEIRETERQGREALGI